MRRCRPGIAILAAALIGYCCVVVAQQKRGQANQRVVLPKSSEELPSDVGVRAHTHLLVLSPGFTKAAEKGTPAEAPPFPGYAFETPASLACLYHLVPAVRGCNPNVVTLNPTGGAKAIAIVDAFDDPNAISDLATFSQQFGLPAANLTVVYASGSKPGVDPTGGWELEESTDIEWAHAMAPNAQIFLVEAASNSFFDLFTAEIDAGSLVAGAGGGEVSNSWGGGEFPEEGFFDDIFTAPGVVYLASTGDQPGTEYPSVSPNVVAIGGTSTNRSPYTGDFFYEGTWNAGAGGPSLFEPRPSYQDVIAKIAGSSRSVPDASLDSNPFTGVWVYDSNPYQGVSGFPWFIVGGTSVSVQSWTGIINAAGRFSASSAAELSLMYEHLHDPHAFNDITRDNCGPYGGFLAEPGYDFCTGLGSVFGYEGK